MPRTGPTDPRLCELINKLRKTKEYRPLADALSKPRRKKRGVNLFEIDESGEKAIATWKVLSMGELSKPVRIYAWDASKNAKEKIVKAGGELLPLEEVLNKKDKIKILV
jgi:large subunit ribosomal protein L18e